MKTIFLYLVRTVIDGIILLLWSVLLFFFIGSTGVHDTLTIVMVTMVFCCAAPFCVLIFNDYFDRRAGLDL
jgi:4-hydroxybenzoate polyprenyltransferase